MNNAQDDLARWYPEDSPEHHGQVTRQGDVAGLRNRHVNRPDIIDPLARLVLGLDSPEPVPR